jgi:hypothetical protein
LIVKLTGYHPAAELTWRLQEAMEKPDFVRVTAEQNEGDLE